MEKDMKCESCGAQMKVGRENYRYAESGLDTITLVDIEVRRCPECGEYEVSVPRIEELHCLIAQQVALKRARLTPQEIRFLRKYLGFSGVDFRRPSTSRRRLSPGGRQARSG
jgi:YgiT-type zinc finger domain-containing protein